MNRVKKEVSVFSKVSLRQHFFSAQNGGVPATKKDRKKSRRITHHQYKSTKPNMYFLKPEFGMVDNRRAVGDNLNVMVGSRSGFLSSKVRLGCGTYYGIYITDKSYLEGLKKWCFEG